MTNINHLYEKSHRIVQRLIVQNKKQFVIYPYNIHGKIVRSVLNFDFEISEIGCASNIDELKEIIKRRNCSYGDVTILLSLDDSLSENEKSDTRFELLQEFSIEQIVDIFSPSMFFDKDMFDDDSYYLQQRKSFMESCSREIYDNHVEGNIAECGVYEGDSAVILNELFPDRKLYLFDTFSGYDERDMTEQEYESWGDYMLFCRERFSHTPTLEDLYRRMPWRNQIQIIKGYFPETALINKDVVSGSYALVNLDMNLYQPMKAGLELFWNRLSPGGIILVDDIRHKGLPSARKAFLEFCETNHLGYSTITYNGMGMAAISKSRR